MKATISPSMGYCIVDDVAGKNASLISLDSMDRLDSESEWPVLSTIHDWQVLESKDFTSVLDEAKAISMTTRCVSLARLRLMISNHDQGKMLCGEIEDLISGYVSANHVIQKMIVAPYKSPEKIKECAMLSLSDGYAATASLLNKLYDLQPLLRRLSHIWLSLPIDRFFNGGISKQEWWAQLYESGNLLKIIEASDGRGVKNVFGMIAFNYPQPRERESVASIGNELSNRLFGSNNNQTFASGYKGDVSDYAMRNEGGSVHWQAKLDRALSEVDGIAKAIASGDEYNAERYLREMIERQTANMSDNKHAVKSLCNLAQQCADMFRTDYEYLCLQKVREVEPRDSWMLIQYGDHFKRRGLYDEARKMANEAIIYGQEKVGKSMLADICAQQGGYSAAIEMYKSISGWHEDLTIRTAIADNLRRLGQLGQALNEYNEIDNDGLGSERTSIGRAEIEKSIGRLDEAIYIYKRVLGKSDLDNRSRQQYRIAYTGILKQIGEYEIALAEIEDVISDAPYSMEARVLRSSIWGLLDKADLGLENLPAVKSHAYGEWVSEYTRGLLLLRTNKYRDAQERLLLNLENSILEVEERTILRLAAALAYIVNGGISEAKELVVSQDVISNSHVKYLANVLEYHVCMVENDTKNAKALYNLLHSKRSDNVILWSAVKALRSGNTDKAIKIEIDAMLSIAA